MYVTTFQLFPRKTEQHSVRSSFVLVATKTNPVYMAAPPTQDEIERRADVLARKPCTLILYSVELARPTPERAHLEGSKEYGQILRPSANPAVALHTRWAERQRHCSDGQRTPGFYYLLHEQGAHSFDVHSEGIHHGKQEDLMRLGDDEESRLVREAGGTFRGYSDKEPQSLNFKKPGQGGARARLLATPAHKIRTWSHALRWGTARRPRGSLGSGARRRGACKSRWSHALMRWGTASGHRASLGSAARRRGACKSWWSHALRWGM